MKVISGYALEDLRGCRIHGNIYWNDSGQGLLALAIDQDGHQFVVCSQGSLDHTIALSHKHSLHVSPAFSAHAQGMIT